MQIGTTSLLCQVQLTDAGKEWVEITEKLNKAAVDMDKIGKAIDKLLEKALRVEEKSKALENLIQVPPFMPSS